MSAVSFLMIATRLQHVLRCISPLILRLGSIVPTLVSHAWLSCQASQSW